MIASHFRYNLYSRAKPDIEIEYVRIDYLHMCVYLKEDCLGAATSYRIFAVAV